jgi:hypothetical protein
MATNPARSPGVERRRSQRRAHVIQSWLAPAGDDSPDARTEISSLDLSQHGVAFGVWRPLTVGSFHVIEIGLGGQRLVSEVRIVSCRPFPTLNGVYRIGAEFC